MGQVRIFLRKVFTFPVIASVVIVLVCAGLIWQVNAHKRQTEHALEVSDCRNKVLVKLVIALNERNTYTDGNSRRSKELWSSQQSMLVTLQDPQRPQEERVRAYAEYLADLSQYLQGLDRAAAQRRDFPLPTAEEINRCR